MSSLTAYAVGCLISWAVTCLSAQHWFLLLEVWWFSTLPQWKKSMLWVTSWLESSEPMTKLQPLVHRCSEWLQRSCDTHPVTSFCPQKNIRDAWGPCWQDTQPPLSLLMLQRRLSLVTGVGSLANFQPDVYNFQLRFLVIDTSFTDKQTFYRKVG